MRREYATRERATGGALRALFVGRRCLLRNKKFWCKCVIVLNHRLYIGEFLYFTFNPTTALIY